MVSRWAKLNYLVPEPQCSMKEIDGTLQITEWKDQRPQPSDSEIDNVTTEQAISQIEDDEAINSLYSRKFNNVLLEVVLGLENRVRTLEGSNTITQTEFITYLKDLYKSI
jgi:hypothetical protein